MLIIITIAAFLATLFGGLFALYLKDKLHLILGFSAGAIIGVAFFDLLPEALELAGSTHTAKTILGVTVVGFVLYMVLDRFFLPHIHADADEHMHEHRHEHEHASPEDIAHVQRGIVGASSLSFHSFLDGIAIGLAFQVSATVGAVVAAAVLTHDFSDGINTVSMILKNGGTTKKALRWLTLDALAPVAGVLSTTFFVVPEEQLGLLLALFAGFFLYIGATDLIPESYHSHPMWLTTGMTIAGIATLFGVITLAGI